MVSENMKMRNDLDSMVPQKRGLARNMTGGDLAGGDTEDMQYTAYRPPVQQYAYSKAPEYVTTQPVKTYTQQSYLPNPTSSYQDKFVTEIRRLAQNKDPTLD